MGMAEFSRFKSSQRANDQEAFEEELSVLRQGLLPNGKIFRTGKGKSLNRMGIQFDAQSRPFRRKQVTVLHFKRLTQQFFSRDASQRWVEIGSTTVEAAPAGK